MSLFYGTFALVIGLGLSPMARAQVADSMADDEDLKYLDEEDGDDEDLFDEPEKSGASRPNAVLLEPVGLSVLPIISYGLGVSHELQPSSASSGRLDLRARYTRGSATMGQLYAVTELTTLELTWSFYKWLFVGAGPAYRNVRTSLQDALNTASDSTSSATATGLSVMIGIERPLGSYLLGCDIVGVVQPMGSTRQVGTRPTEADDRDPHARTLEKAGTQRSLSLLRLYFGPRF